MMHDSALGSGQYEEEKKQITLGSMLSKMAYKGVSIAYSLLC